MTNDVGRRYHAFQDPTQQFEDDAKTRRRKCWILCALIFCLCLATLFIFWPYIFEEESLKLITPIKSPADTNDYGFFRLRNGLRVFLISDPKTETSAASIDYGAGSYFDFFGTPRRGTKGLAHFHEHMLFLGSQQYPGEDDFTSLLSKYSGSDNAYTSSESTNFHFSCQNDGFREVLKVWAAFFKNPLLTESSMNREMHAVHSEYTKDVPNSGWRQWTMMKHMADPGHPFHTFTIGTIDTLNVSHIHSYLVDWHKTFFSSHIATLALYSKESLKTMKQWADDIFHDIAEEPRDYPLVDGNPFPASRQRKIWYMKPLTETNTMSIVWQIPATLYDYRVPALEWIFALINFPGPNSLKEMLINKDLATSISAEDGDTSRSFGVAVISIALTIRGLDNIAEIVGYVMQYIRLITSQALSEDWRFQEYTDIDAVIWQFKTKPQGRSSLVTSLASSMHFRDPKHILYPEFTSPPSTYLWNVTLIRSVLERMTAQSASLLVTTMQHDYSNASKEEYFQVEYTVNDIEGDVIESWANAELDANLTLPPKNKWVIHDTSMFPSSKFDGHPIVVYNQSDFGIRGWFSYRVEKNVPTVWVDFILRNSFAYESATALITAKMYSNLIAYHFGRQFAQAGAVGYSVGFSVELDGLSISFSGYHEHLQELIVDMLALVLSPTDITVAQAHFDSLKVEINHALRSHILASAYSQTKHTFALLTQPSVFDWQEQIDALNVLTMDDVSDWVRQIQGRVQTEYFVYGNANETYANDVADLVFPLINNTVVSTNLTHYHIPAGLTIINRVNQNPSDKNSASDIFFQAGSADDLHSKVIMSLISPILHEKCFDTLRTKETLGYIVSAAGTVYDHVLYQRIVIVGPKHDASHFLDRVFAFIQSFYDDYVMDELDETILQDLKDSTLKKYERKDLSVSEWHDRYWSEIESTTYNWAYHEILAEAVKKVELEDVRSYYRAVFLNETRRILAVQLFSSEREVSSPTNVTYTVIDSLDAFRSDPNPFIFPIEMRH